MTRAEALKIAKPILFNTEMVRAILGGTKTVTRWLIKPQPANKNDIIYKHDECGKWFISPDDNYPETEVKMPYKVGDILYVRETWGQMDCNECGNVNCKQGNCNQQGFCYRYKSDGSNKSRITGDWQSLKRMPKEATRIFLWVTGVRVERLQDIITGDI